MSKIRKIAFYSMIPTVIICLFEGGIYYSSYGITGLARILCTLENTIRIFIARPTISSYYAFKIMNNSFTPFEVFITYFYAVIVFVAPILATTAVVAGFSAYILDFIHSIKITFKEKMFVIGDGHMASTIAYKYADKYYVNYLMPDYTKDEERVPLLRKDIRAYTISYEGMSNTCKDSKIEKASCVVLNFKDWFESYKAVTDIIEYIVINAPDKTITVFFIDAPNALKDVFNKMYEGLCKKNGRPMSVISAKFINVNEMNAGLFFENPHFTVQANNYHHIVFTGIGDYGRAMLRGLFYYMTENHLSGTIEIIDRHVERNVNDLMFSTESIKRMDMFEEVEIADKAKYSSVAVVDDSRIQFNFYQATVGELKYTNILTEIINRERVTEYFLCVEDVATNIESYRMMSGLEDSIDDIKIYFRVSEKLSNAFEAIKVSSPQLDYLPDSFPDIELFSEKEQ